MNLKKNSKPTRAAKAQRARVPIQIAVILPSRGLLFSRSFEELLAELKPFKHKIFFAHGRPLPECFNEPLTEALKYPNWTHILICEDDMVLPKNILLGMLSLLEQSGAAATALDYPFKDNDEATTLHDPQGYALYTGTGFLLCRRFVLEAIPKPVFRTDVAWDSRIKGDRLQFWARDVSKVKTYGLHDVHFGLTLWSNNLPILPAAPGGQRKLVRLGQPGTNNGAHEIKIINKVLKDMVVKSDKEIDRMKWLARLSQVKVVEILKDVPADIMYVKGQAVPRKGKFDVI
jgi:hypothetical protein